MSVREARPLLRGFVVIPKLNQARRVNGNGACRRAVGEVNRWKRAFAVWVRVRRVEGQ